MASSLTLIVAVVAAAAARIAQNVRKELAYVVDDAVKAFCGDVCRISTTAESASSLRERATRQTYCAVSVRDWCCCPAGELSERDYVGVKALPRQE